MIKRLFLTFKEDRYRRKLFRRKLLKKLKLNFLTDITKGYNKNHKNFKYNSIMDLHKLDFNKSDLENLEIFFNMYEENKFNILGSGWTKFDYSEAPKGFEGYFYDCSKLNLTETLSWHIDIKSGYVFDSFLKSSEIRKNIPVGVDIKVPWELSRMYHLPQIALYGFFNITNRQKVITIFIEHITNFMDNNIIGFGVNYSNPMEIAIRNINLLIAFDIINQIDSEQILTETFKHKVINRILNEGQYIMDNLELDLINNINGNHYLANLCGILFISSYISTSSSQKWFNFAEKEVYKEIKKQFLKDGSSFECSTYYHRLSMELMMYCLILINNKSGEFLTEHSDIFNKIYDFLILVRKDNGTMIQVGDNDSGRVIKPIIRTIESYVNKNDKLEENDLLIDNVLVMATALFNEPIAMHQSKYKLEYSFIKSLKKFPVINKKESNLFAFEIIEQDINLNDFHFKNTIEIESCFEKPKLRISKDFGIAVFESSGNKLFVRIHYNTKDKLLAHAHDDVLHFEIFHHGETLFFDPGSYTYTPIIELRNLYRGRSYHNVPHYGDEVFEYPSPFKVETKFQGEIIKASDNELGVLFEYKDVRHYRHFNIQNNKIIINDYGNKKFNISVNNIYESIGYGKKQKNRLKEKIDD